MCTHKQRREIEAVQMCLRKDGEIAAGTDIGRGINELYDDDEALIDTLRSARLSVKRPPV